MTAVAVTPIDMDDSVFDAASYDLPIPSTEGRKAQKLSVRFTGSCDLDRTSEDDLVS
jgi:hypothetical protein